MTLSLFSGCAILANHLHTFSLHVGRCLVKIVVLTSHGGECLLTLATERFPFHSLSRYLLIDCISLRLWRVSCLFDRR